MRSSAHSRAGVGVGVGVGGSPSAASASATSSTSASAPLPSSASSSSSSRHSPLAVSMATAGPASSGLASLSWLPSSLGASSPSSRRFVLFAALIIAAGFAVLTVMFQRSALVTVEDCRGSSAGVHLERELEEKLHILEKQMNYNKRLSKTLREAVDSMPSNRVGTRVGLDAAVHAAVDAVAKRIVDDVTQADLSSATSTGQQQQAELRAAVEAAARRTGKWAAFTVSQQCRPCPDCDAHKVWVGPTCTVGGFVNCTCANGASGLRAFRPGVGPQDRPLCSDGASPGRWVNFSHWEADNCQYRDISKEELRQCLRGKWVHFFGDSLSRLMANAFAHKCGMQRQNWEANKNRSQLMDTSAGEGSGTDQPAASLASRMRRRRLASLAVDTDADTSGDAAADANAGADARGMASRSGGAGHQRHDEHDVDVHDEEWEEWSVPVEEGIGRSEEVGQKQEQKRRGRSLLVERDEWPRITYLFRGKMAHQRHPAENTTEENDLNNAFLHGFKQPGARQPDFLIMSMGAHEVIGWNARPPPDLDLRTFESDTEELLRLLADTFDRSRGELIWWKAHYIWPGKLLGRDYFRARYFHELYQAHAYRRFREAGFRVADFYQTTEERPELIYKPDGVHYGGEALATHTRILANMLCNNNVMNSYSASVQAGGAGGSTSGGIGNAHG